jgi:hypothetical protein
MIADEATPHEPGRNPSASLCAVPTLDAFDATPRNFAMVDLVILACLLTAPTDCRHHVISDEGSIPTWHFSSMLTVARWAGDHPNWRVRSFSCRDFERQS